MAWRAYKCCLSGHDQLRLRPQGPEIPLELICRARRRMFGEFRRDAFILDGIVTGPMSVVRTSSLQASTRLPSTAQWALPSNCLAKTYSHASTGHAYLQARPPRRGCHRCSAMKLYAVSVFERTSSPLLHLSTDSDMNLTFAKSEIEDKEVHIALPSKPRKPRSRIAACLQYSPLWLPMIKADGLAAAYAPA